MPELEGVGDDERRESARRPRTSEEGIALELDDIRLRGRSAEDILGQALDVLLRELECDRAWVMPNPHPGARGVTVALERMHPDWQHLLPVVLPLTANLRQCFDDALAHPGVRRYDSQHLQLDSRAPGVQRFSIRSQMMMRVPTPHNVTPWFLGTHHCAEARVYSERDSRIFSLVGRGIAQPLLRFVEHRQAERARHQLDAAQRIAGLCSFDWDSLSGITHWSEHAQGVLGRPPNPVQPVFAVLGSHVAESRREEFDLAVERICRMEGEHSLQTLAVSPAGEPWWMRIRCDVVVDGLGQCLKLAGVVQNVSDQVRAAERERELLDRLQHAQKQEAIGRLSGGVAHDVNNALSVILGAADDLREGMGHGMEHGEIARAVGDIERAGLQAAAITRKLLAFSRKQALEPEVFDLTERVDRFQDTARRVRHSRVELEWAPPQHSSCRVRADPNELDGALLNLTLNAMDAMPKGGRLSFAVELRELSPAEAHRRGVRPGRFGVVHVADTGLGISKDIQDKIWEPFFTTKGVGAGTGLGLSTVHGFVLQSGGFLSLESEPGRGTRMSLHFPEHT